MNRRRAITLCGAATLCGLSSCRRTAPPRTYTGFAFGTEVHFQIHGITEHEFDEVSALCTTRLTEIQSLFSLYDPDSAISRLNRDGRMANPPGEFLHLIRSALEFGEKTGGIFDITVQPLWNWRQNWKDASDEKRQTMDADSWKKTLALVDYRNVRTDGDGISYAKPGMAITLNGIVQGYATDQIASLLKNHGVRHALVNIGEYAAIGSAPGGKPWTVELAPNGETVALPAGRSLAVSAGSGHTFEQEGRLHHIFRPSDGINTRPHSTIVVTAPTATIADALSTTFTIASDAERLAILPKFPGTDFREIRA